MGQYQYIFIWTQLSTGVSIHQVVMTARMGAQILELNVDLIPIARGLERLNKV